MAPTEVRDDAVTPDASVVPVRVPAGATTAFPVAEVTSPLALIVIDGIEVDDPVVPALATVARVSAADPGPDAEASPVNAVI
jgi:hypothetical protein